LRLPKDSYQNWISKIGEAKDNLRFCDSCGGLSETEICKICSSPKRDLSILCVIEQPEDIFFIENTKEFFGTYHVLGGVISPLDGIGPEQLRIKELFHKLENHSIQEVLIATNPTLEGDATASYLSEIIKKFGIKVSRIAHGITIGGTIEYSDQYTLGRAIKTRLTL